MKIMYYQLYNLMNIVYENKTGSAGFTTFFNRIDDTGSLKVTYNKKQ